MRKKTYYDRISSGYDKLYKEEQLNKLYIILKFLHIKPNESVLDVGCGTNFCLDYIKSSRKVGIDPSIELLKKSYNSCVVGKAENLPFRSKSFDYVLCLTAIHNFDNPEKGLGEMLRVAKKMVIVSVLKRSPKAKHIEGIIKNKCYVFHKAEEVKDTIFFIKP